MLEVLVGSKPNAICPICKEVSDVYVDHQVGCGGNGDRIHRHDSIRDALFSAAQSAALAPRKEVPSLIPGCSSRPADVFLPIWDRGRPAALDVTVISTMQKRALAGAATTQGFALSLGEDRKRAAHSKPCKAIGVDFIPLVVESFGGWSSLAVDTIRRIGRLQGQRLGVPPADTTRHLTLERKCIPLSKTTTTAVSSGGWYLIDITKGLYTPSEKRACNSHSDCTNIEIFQRY